MCFGWRFFETGRIRTLIDRRDLIGTIYTTAIITPTLRERYINNEIFEDRIIYYS
jgi:hypothetical protein